jgi:hypothetical protein
MCEFAVFTEFCFTIFGVPALAVEVAAVTGVAKVVVPVVGVITTVVSEEEVTIVRRVESGGVGSEEPTHLAFGDGSALEIFGA